MSKSVYRGKQKLAVKEFDEVEADPKEIVEAIVYHRKASVREHISMHIATSKGSDAVLDDNEKLTDLLNRLVECKLLDPEEIKVWDVSDSRIKMSMKIARYADVFMDERVLPLLEPGYSLLYQIARLYEEIEADEKILEALT